MHSLVFFFFFLNLESRFISLNWSRPLTPAIYRKITGVLEESYEFERFRGPYRRTDDIHALFEVNVRYILYSMSQKSLFKINSQFETFERNNL